MNWLSNWIGPSLEHGMRQIYWRSKPLRRLRAYVKKHRPLRPVDALLSEAELRDILAEIGLGTQAPIAMVHTSVDRWAVRNPDSGKAGNAIETAGKTLNVLLALTSEHQTTLAMPTHPLYKETAEDFLVSSKNLVLTYNVKTTPCKVGLINEMFRRKPGVERSLHPMSSMACIGPLSRYLLENNLNDNEPLPHGKDSSYYRVCLQNGLVVSIGCPLMNYFTLRHTLVEINEDEHPGWAYRRRPFQVVMPDGRTRQVIVRDMDPAITCRCLNKKLHRRDLLREGLLKERTFSGVRIDWISAGEMLEFSQKKRGCYPYLPFWLACPMIR